MNPMDLAKAIEEYSAFVVILAIFCLVTTFLIKRNTKNLEDLQERSIKENEEYRKHFSELIDKLMDTLLDENTNVSVNCPKKNSCYSSSCSSQGFTSIGIHREEDLFGKFVKLRDALKINCLTTMNSVNASRIAIYLFHNGMYSTHGISFFKMSCICEKVVVGSGIRERTIEHSNIPLNLFDNMINELIVNGEYIIKNSEDLRSNHSILISSPKIKYAHAVSIYDSNNNILGFILIEMKCEYDEDYVLDETAQLKTLVSQVTPILTYSNYIDTTLNK